LLSFPEGRKALWERAKARLRDPVRTTVRLWERDIPKRFRLLASESALAEWTNLNPPPSPVYAVGRKGWNEIHKSKPDEIPVEEPGTCTVQIWRYDPTLFASQSCVDAFSLFLSLEHESDERVSAALGRLMEHIPSNSVRGELFTLASRPTRPTPGWRNNFGKRHPMAKPRVS